MSIVIPCLNEAGYVEACLRSILNQEHLEGGFEVIVADGMSSDGTREIVERMRDGIQKSEVRDQWSEVGGQESEADSPLSHGPASLSHPPRLSVLTPHSSEAPSSQLPAPWLRVIDNPARIVSTGLNAAIAAARGGIIIRMDAHTEYAPDYVVCCVEELEKTDGDNVGGPARTKAESFMEKAVAAAYHSPFAVGGARFHDVDFEGWVDTVTYGCWRKEAFKRFGYFDEELVRNQDDEHNLRIIRGGGKIWQSPKIRSWYRPRGSVGALFKQYMQYGYWKVRVIQKHKLPASWRHLVPGAFVLALLLLALGSVVTAVWSVVSSQWSVAPWSHGPMVLSSFPPSGPVVSGRVLALSLYPPFALAALLSAYALALITASLITAAKAGWRLLPILPLVFPCYHFGYGLGFVRGVWDFFIRRRGATAAFTQLTRGARSSQETAPAEESPQESAAWQSRNQMR